MCGIVAQAGFRSELDSFTRALDSLSPRGPDNEGYWQNRENGVRLGHRRLSIIDLSDSGNQPMSNEDKNIWLVCNGEIYNYPALRKNLEALGHRFSSNSDSEVIIHAYESWGTACIEKLEGMFAFALWDSLRQRLFAARDRVGMKPLFYSNMDGGGISLASDAEALRHLTGKSAQLDPFALSYVLTMGYIPSPWCVWKGFRKLPPGHSLTWDEKHGIKLEKYWEPPRELVPSLESDPDEWSSLYEKVINDHLLSDVPTGMFLSAGLDSTSLALGLKRSGHPIEAVTISFPGSPKDEGPQASATAKFLGLSSRVIPLKNVSVAELREQVSRIIDEPYGYSALLSNYLVSREAANQFKVVLSGDGGDEIFGGYNWYRDLDAPLGKGGHLGRKVLRPLVRRGANGRVIRLASRYFSQTSVMHRHAWRIFPRFLPEEAELLFEPMGVQFDDEALLAPYKAHFESGLPLKRALQRVDLMNFCGDYVLGKVDRASMAHSLEVRVPFLDRRIIERTITSEISARESTENKPILRDYVRGQVPDHVLTQAKQGFSLSSGKTFEPDDAIEQIEQGPWVREGYWSPRWKRLVAEDVPFRKARILILLVMTQWLEQRV